MTVARNDPCPCGSGKKYKRCHLESDRALSGGQSPRIVERRGEKYLVSHGVTDSNLDAAANYFANRDTHRGPAQEMADFVQPLLDTTDGSIEEMNKIFSLGMLCWNIALLPTQRRESAISETTAKFAKADEDKNAFHSMIEMMVARHEGMFPRLHQRRAFEADNERTVESTRESAQ